MAVPHAFSGAAARRSARRLLTISSTSDVSRDVVDQMTGNDPREQRWTRPMRVLYVVARDRPDLYESLRASFTESPRLGIVLDRRTGRSSERAADAVAERRHLEVDQALRTHGWARVRIEADGRAVLSDTPRSSSGGA